MERSYIKKLNSTRVSHFFPTRICRAALVVWVMLVGVGSVWGQTVSFSSKAVTREFYLNKGSQSSADVDVSGKISKICEDLSSVAGTTITPASLSNNYVLLWGLGDASGNIVTSTSTVNTAYINDAVGADLFKIKSMTLGS
jgi:hypothetical protein